MEQVGGWGEVMNATVLTKGGREDIVGILRLEPRACAGQVGVWNGGAVLENQVNDAAPEQKTAMRYRLLVGNEVTAAVLLPARFGRLHAERLFLAPTG
jgi:hypothetical protein